MFSSARLVTSLHSTDLQGLRGSLLACKYLTIGKWEERNMHHCRSICGNSNHHRSFSQTFITNILLSRSNGPTSKPRPLPLICRAFTKKSSPAREQKLRLNDSVPSGYDLIYKAPMDGYMLLAQGVSTLSLLLLFASSIYKTVQGNVEIISITTKIGNMVENNEQLLILGVSLLVASIAIRALTSKYPLRIYHCNGSYISIFTPQLPLQTKSLAFRKGDVKHMQPKGILPWKDSKYAIGEKEVIIFEDFFRKPADFTAMMETHSM